MTTSAERRPPVALSLRGVIAAYGREPVVEGVTGQVEPGAALALIGPNGAGKSTLIRAILGLAPVVAGHIEVLGRPPAQARGSVAYVPQAEVLDPDFPVSALQVVVMARYRHRGWFRRPSKADLDIARRALDQVGLASRAGERFGTLSGGQRQRVLLARAIAQEARLLLLDEPFTGLDTATTDSFVEVLTRLRGEGVAVVMATHDLSVAHLVCGHACLLNRRQVAFGPIEKALTPELLAQTYGPAAVVLAGGSTIVTAR